MRIVLDGDPVSQIRMKFSGRNGIGRVYDPRQKIKALIKCIVKEQWHDVPQFAHPRVSFIFHMAIPKSTPKKLLPLYNSGLLKHEKKPDSDNIVKLYLDCMTGSCFEGDEKVQIGYAVKLYHPHPKTIIIVNEMRETLSPLEVDPATFLLLSGESGKCSSSEMLSLPGFYTPDLLVPSLSANMTYPQQTVPSCVQ